MDNGTCSQAALDDYLEDQLDNYFCSDVGLVLPIVNEYTWPYELRAFLYLLGLLWCFLGVAIIADTFMVAIEKITSKTRTLKVANAQADDGYEEVEIKVWNNTVANLTLMALGSSAPEILLSCIEIIFKGFKSGDLGPSTIVGSAAFNLLVITAVCILAIPSPDIRRIGSFKVFAVTAFSSIFAYIWLIIILIGNTKDIVDIWEAVVTLLFFPILVIVAYLVDKDFCAKKKTEGEAEVELGFVNKMVDRMKLKDGYQVSKGDDSEDENGRPLSSQTMDPKKMRELIKELRAVHPNLSEDDIVRLASAKMLEEESHSHLWYRINATRNMGGSYKLTPSFDEILTEVYENLKEREAQHADPANVIKDDHFTDDFSEKGTKTVVEFTAARVSVLESDKRVRLGIRRYGKTSVKTLVKVETIEGTAEAHKDYIPIKTTIVFEKDETFKFIEVEIIDDNEWEPDEVFFVKLTIDIADPGSKAAICGKHSIADVTIINDDEPGTFEFAKPSFIFKESAGLALIPIERQNGCDGKVVIKYSTEDMTATAGKDYEGGEGEIVFEHGETTKTLEIVIYDDQEYEKDETFKVDLLEVPEGAKLGRIKKTIVTIVNDDDFNGMVSRLVNMTNTNLDSIRVGRQTWAEQFRNALNVNGGDLDTATNMDYIMHFLTFPWKIIFALVPPPSIWGGWLSFFIALGMIGVLTMIVGDLAGTFGCLVKLEDSVTAITFVALGTSLPDLFASKQAALTEKTADNSIGNVTGSNSVNVFLGLGLPWTIAAIYWGAQGKSFPVKAGTLTFSVMLYSIAAATCVAVLVLRRYLGFFGKGELGGKYLPKIGCAILFVLLWILYVLLSALQTYGHIKVNL